MPSELTRMWSNLKRRKWTGLLLVVGLFWWEFHKSRPEVIYNASYIYNRLAEEDVLIKSFDQTVFYNDQGKLIETSLLIKWIKPVKFITFNYPTKEQQKTIFELSNLLERLSGIKIRKIKSSETGANVHLHFNKHEKFADISAGYGNDKAEEFEKFQGVLCRAIMTYTRKSGYKFAINFINTELDEDGITACILEEFSHILGVGDGAYYVPSVFADTRFPEQLSINDKIMIRTLYDKRLKLGMTRDEAMPIVRKIIPELVAAVQERGEEALYQ